MSDTRFENSNSPSNLKQKQCKDSMKSSPDVTRGLLISPVKKLSALRLVSPIDSDQEQNDLEVASVLAEGGSVSPNKPKHHGTPIRPATVMTNVQRGNVQTTTPIFQSADLNKVDEYGLSPLLWACANGQLITVKYMLEKMVDLNIVGPQAENALLFASCYGYTDIVKLLLDLGMNVNYVDETQGSSLMYSAYNNHAACVKVLLEYGSDITLKNEDGHTAMDLAVGQGHKIVQQMIEAHILKLLEMLT